MTRITTAGQNYTFTSTDKIGSSPILKPSSHSTRSATTTNADSGSTDKKDKKQSSSATTKSDNTPTINNDDSNQILKSSHQIRSGNGDTLHSGPTTTKTSGLPSDLAPSIKNNVDSIIRNSMKGITRLLSFYLFIEAIVCCPRTRLVGID